MDGRTLNEIAGTLGHKTLAMVQRYAHLTDGHVQDAMLVLEILFADLFPDAGEESHVRHGQFAVHHLHEDGHGIKYLPPNALKA